MFRFIKQMFIGLLSIFSIESFCVSLVFLFKINYNMCNLKQSTMPRLTLFNINSDKGFFFYPFTVSVNKCGGRK